MNILLLYPRYPDTFWSFKHALKFVSKKAVNPPLGLITISAMLPKNWNKKLIDLNIEKLRDKDLDWADLVFISAMSIQTASVFEIIGKCKWKNKKIIAGGPLFTEDPHRFSDIDYLVLNEAELTLIDFLEDYQHGKAQHIYQTDEFADLSLTPLPDYSLVKISKYDTLNLQYTRGCPFNCEFCDITALFGRRVRTKTTPQIINELENIYKIGWRRNVFFVDDNFIGNKKVLKGELLPAIIKWMGKKAHPFTFTTEASINLADDDELIDMMSKAGFSSVFVGIETPEEASLKECGKIQNKNRNMIDSVKKIQSGGLEVAGGFILGFDNDSSSVFQRQIDFIKESGIISAMVGLLNAPKRTRLYKRLYSEGRILKEISGNNTDLSLNFIPRMDKNRLINGYKSVISGIYGGKAYYKRVHEFLKRFNPNRCHGKEFNFTLFIGFMKSIIKLGIFDTYRLYYWRLFMWTLFKRPQIFPLAIIYSVYGYHFRKVFKSYLDSQKDEP